MLTTPELLAVWEEAHAQPPVRRALALLAAANPALSAESLAGLSIGERDARLLVLREQLFGPRLLSVTACGRCGERLELDFGVGDIRAPVGSAPANELTVCVGEFVVCFRLPNSRDLATLMLGAAEQPRALLRRCLVSVTCEGVSVGGEALTPQVEREVAAGMLRADPQADVRLALACPACGHAWQSAFDIVSFLWCEIDVWARRLLRDVHTLASAYGWREADILAMSPRRRGLYLELIQ